MVTRERMKMMEGRYEQDPKGKKGKKNNQTNKYVDNNWKKSREGAAARDE
jgi:hypothetical protein